MPTRSNANFLSAVLFMALFARALVAASQPRSNHMLWARGGEKAAAFAAGSGGDFKALNSRNLPPKPCRVIGLIGGMASGKSTVAQLLREQGAVVIDADKLGHAAYAPGTRGHTALVAAFGPQVLDESGNTIDRAKLRNAVFGPPSNSNNNKNNESRNSSSSSSSSASRITESNGLVQPLSGNETKREAARAASDSTETTASQRKATLESIVWPLVREAIEARIADVQRQRQEEQEEKLQAAPMEEEEVQLPPIENDNSGQGPPSPRCIVVEAALLLEAGWADLCDEIWAVVADQDVAVQRLLQRDPHIKPADAVARVRSSEGADRPVAQPLQVDKPSRADASAKGGAEAGAEGGAGAKMMSARAARYEVCDVVIDNSNGLDELKAQVESLWRSRVVADDETDGASDCPDRSV